jgi:glycosyltransferase involved in cell wall biosynthesis
MEPYLKEAVDSVLVSDYPSLELVLMDDGSSDDSLLIAQEYAVHDPRVQVHTQTNAGACAARNHAIALAKGKYILPVDADDRIDKCFISEAVARMESDNELKVVYSHAEFFGDRAGEWKLLPFSLSLLARKNMIPITALFRREDWEQAGGYCQEIIAREDWEFWIAILKNGGKVIQLPQSMLYYRVRANSKRISDRALKRHVIDVLNRRHPEFFEQQLGGKLHYNRTWSKLLNRLSRIIFPRRIVVNPQWKELELFIRTLPVHFRNEGIPLYKGRNELKEFREQGYELVVKSFRIPNIFNQLAYNLFRPSKARRSYRYAERLRKAGVGSPQPIGFYSTGTWLMFGHSYYVSLKSTCPYTYRGFATRDFSRKDDILRAIARTTARMHEQGFLHKDYSAGNILFEERADGTIHVEIIDLNRMRFGRVSMEKGCKNFERLPGTPAMFKVLADEYARVRGFDAHACLRLIEKAHAADPKTDKRIKK